MSRRGDAFTLLELLVVITVLILVAGLLLPVVSRATTFGYRAACLSNQRQLNLALRIYAEDHDGFVPPRQIDQRWPRQLQPYYVSPSLLVCPSDSQPEVYPIPESADAAPRSYSLNGFGDPNVNSFVDERESEFMNGPRYGRIRLGSIAHPSDTVLFGETRGSTFYVELKRESGSFVEVLELGRHGPGRAAPFGDRNGGANHAFADGSVRYYDFGKALCPVNLWGVTDYYRTNYAICFF